MPITEVMERHWTSTLPTTQWRDLLSLPTLKWTGHSSITVTGKTDPTWGN